METWNESHTQQFWDICAKRAMNGPTYYDDMYMCIYNVGYNFKLLDSYYARDLQLKDIVIYHAFGYDNNTDLHSSVIESVNLTNKTLVIANPWGSYDFYTFREFESVYAGKGIRIKSHRTSYDRSFITDINETSILENSTYDNDICIKIYKERAEIEQQVVVEKEKTPDIIDRFNKNRKKHKKYGCR